MFFKRASLIVGLGVLLCGSTSLVADQITLTAVADTSLWQRETNHNLGGAEMLPVGTIGNDGNESKSHLLLKFDIAGNLPANAVIESATVKLHQLRSPDTSINRTFRAYRVLSSWGEGVKTYADPQAPLQSTQEATVGEATWIDRMFGIEGKAWISAGGGVDEDFGDDANFDFFSQSGTDRDYEKSLLPAGLDTLNSWLSAPEQNFGWAIIVDNENLPFSARQIASRENANLEHRPQLTIVYSVPGPAQPEIQLINRTGDSVTIVYSAGPGVVYRPQFKGTVNGAAWTDLPDQGPLGAAGTLQFIDDVTGVDERYYQVTIPTP